MTPRQRYYRNNREKEIAASQAWNKAHPEEYAKKRHEGYLRNREKILQRAKLRFYGLTAEQYQELMVKFPDCGICHTTERQLQIDHCHETKKIRGLLCANCNTGIGLLKESPEIIRRAITYLTNTK